jgi:hypothetical protein
MRRGTTALHDRRVQAPDEALVVLVDRGSMPIAGSIVDCGVERRFVGWIELTSRLEDANALPRRAGDALKREGSSQCPPSSGSTSAGI